MCDKMITTLTVKKVKNGWEASIYEDDVRVVKIEGVDRTQVVREGLNYLIQYINDESGI
jgi:hypothetical protein